MKPCCKMHAMRVVLIHHFFEGFDMLHSFPTCIIHEELGIEQVYSNKASMFATIKKIRCRLESHLVYVITKMNNSLTHRCMAGELVIYHLGLEWRRT